MGRKKPLRWYIGWDPRDTLAFEVCAHSLLKHATVPVEIVPLKDWEVRKSGHFWREFYLDASGQLWDLRDNLPCSTLFSYLRFAIPLLEAQGDDWVGWCDADMLWRADVGELLGLVEPDRAVMCVRHDHAPTESEKMVATIQRRYRRKNWSSLMLLRPSACRGLTRYALNNQSKDWLHQFCWLAGDEKIGALPAAWNWLCGWSGQEVPPKVVHFTRGTPDMPGHAEEPYAAEWWRALAESGTDLAAFPIPAR